MVRDIIKEEVANMWNIEDCILLIDISELERLEVGNVLKGTHHRIEIKLELGFGLNSGCLRQDQLRAFQLGG